MVVIFTITEMNYIMERGRGLPGIKKIKTAYVEVVSGKCLIAPALNETAYFDQKFFFLIFFVFKFDLFSSS